MSQLKLSPADEPKVRDVLERVWCRDISADDGWDELETMLAAAPQPPVGRDVGVLHWLISVEGYKNLSAETSEHAQDTLQHYVGRGRKSEVIELVDRAHVTARDHQITALQARVAELEAQLKKAHGRFKYIAGGGKFYLSAAAEGMRNAHYELAQQVTK